ncbi:hypothetical protein CDV36_004371 [Fusarium kuroshium]|uniref:SAC3/GANP/THP3 conserved domain-containing protein n=1 Tax=Fusarium kuroshium TaxID=2010991 RepID=A0A3M2SEG6_9HYPO|nr:hypothetical protein CDV36_004371 [Fusarium kuroshium]
MPRKWIDKKSAQHFTLVHRPQNDPLIHDENAPSMVLNPTQTKKGSSKSKDLDDLASELGYEAENIRANEGEAASYGVYYDDTEYDYMQHLRDLNTGGGEVVFVESTATANKGKGKQKQSLEDALKKLDIEQEAGDILDEDILPSKNLTRVTYEAQQDIPDSIKGFQPDMDPRLREVLEALDDEAYVDEEDDDLFQQLAKDGRELDDYEFEDTQFDEDDGWESDATAKPNKEYNNDEVPKLVKAPAEHPEEGPSQDWLEDFKEFKKEQKSGRAPAAPSELQSNWTTTTNGGRRKKRKGALTDASSYSMTSSSLVRTEQMTLLDARFDKIEERYNEDLEDDMQSMSAVSTMSTVQGPIRSDFDNIMDDFLGNYTKPGKRTSKKTKAQTGLEQLDEIRKGLGPARIRGRIRERLNSSINIRQSRLFVPRFLLRTLRAENPPHVQTTRWMSATTVASSTQAQMISTFGQPTRSQPPAFNPFATNSKAGNSSFGIDDAGDSNRFKRNKRPADKSDNEGKRKSNKDANMSDSGKQKKWKGEERKRKNGDVKKNFEGAKPFKKAPQNAQANGSNPFTSTRDDESRPTSSSSVESQIDGIPKAYHSNDPHARKVFEQLRKDSIFPPPWPSQPGNPKNKAEVSKFREKYEAYRSKARASLTKAGLIDDPDKRKTLQDAIDFKGICEDMCPEYEKIQRINEMDVHQPEKNPKTTFPNTRRMVKKLARSAAGQEAPLPMDVRSVAALRRTFDYLIDELLRNDGKLPTLHGFLWDRTRAIRRDFTFFSSLNPEEMKSQVYVLENIARFHVTALHLLSQQGNAPEDFVEQQELEQLGKALLSLRDAYDDCNDQGIRCENEPEFRAYYLVFHAYDSNILETLQRQWKPNLWKDHDEVRTAVSLVEALQDTQDFHGPIKDAPSLAASAAYHSYFRILEDPKVSYTMACFAECHFPRLRRSILTTIKKSLARPRETAKDVTAAVLNKFLRFDTVEEAIEFAELHEFEFGECEDDPSDINRQYLKLDNRKRLPHHRYQHQFSQTLVEKKRGSRPLPDLIHQTIHEDPNAPKPTTNGNDEGSLFVTDEPEPPTQAQPVESSEPNSTTTNPFSSFKPNGVLGSNNAVNGNSGTLLNGNSPASTSPFQQSTPQQNPFASASAPAAEPTKPAANPFASSTTSVFTTGTTTSNESSGITTGATTTNALNSFSSAIPPLTSAGPAQAQTQSNPFAWPSTSDSQTPKAPSFPSFAPQPSIPSNDTPTPPSKVDAPTSLLPQALATPVVEPAKSTDSNEAPPSSGPAIDTSRRLKPTPPDLRSISGRFSKPSIGSPHPPTDKQDKPVPSVLGSGPAVTSTPQLPFPAFSTPSYQPPSLESTPTQLDTTEPPKPTIQTPQPPTLPSVPPEPPAPPRDLIGDFTKWYVLGDEGMLGDFQAFMLDNILQGVYRKFVKDKERKRQKEEEEQALAKATEFRRYTLSVRYFYRWRDTARELRLSQLRRSGREQMRVYYEAQRAAQLKAQKAEARRAAREKAELAELNRHRPEELMELVKHKKPGKRRQSEEDALLATGVLSGIGNEREAIAQIVHGPPSVNGTVSSQQSKLSRISVTKGGSKTRALREQLLGERSSTFRRSLPPSMSGNGSSPEPSNRVSRVSERWRLKAMGIVQMPDGTAMPESLANEIQYSKKRHSGTSTMGPPSSNFIRRASVSDLARSEGGHRLSNSHGSIDTTEFDGTAANNKRKRATEDEDDTSQQGASNTHKRVMSDAQKLISELRAMRAEMEEGASWFHDQNERLQSEISRGSTPWDQGS